ncbi:MAG: hypothetical protein U0L05_02040 [Schaedlerella sp.]|nr:hypothetical protein [Schaedlerella sp.]
MKKIDRILAMSGVIILVLLYASTLIFAFMDSEQSANMLMASVAATILIPVLIYGLLLFTKHSKYESDDSSKE